MHEDFISEYVIDVKGRLFEKFKHEYVQKKKKKFLRDKNTQIENFEIIEPKFHISYEDFSTYRESLMSDIYLGYFNNIKKQSNNVILDKKICISFDERLCSQYCAVSDRKFTTINLGGEDIVYFVFFEIKEVFDFIYAHTGQNTNHSFSDNNAQNINEENKLNLYTVEKVGYIHNHNERLSFIRVSIEGDEGFPIPHSIYPEISHYKVGTPIKAVCEVDLNGKVLKTVSFSVCGEKELGIDFEVFEGELERRLGNAFAFIKNEGNSIYVPKSLARDFEENRIYKVECLAVESYDKNKNQRGWEAVEINIL